MPAQVEPTVLTVREVAERLRISRASAYQLCKEPGFPAARVGGQIRVPVTAFHDWLEQQIERRAEVATA